MALGKSEPAIMLSSVLHNPWNIQQSFKVVDQGGPAPEPMLGWIRWSRPHLRPASFDGIKQGGFLTAEIAAVPDKDFDVEIQIFAEQSHLTAFGDGTF